MVFSCLPYLFSRNSKENVTSAPDPPAPARRGRDRSSEHLNLPNFIHLNLINLIKVVLSRAQGGVPLPCVWRGARRVRSRCGRQSHLALVAAHELLHVRRRRVHLVRRRAEQLRRGTQPRGERGRGGRGHLGDRLGRPPQRGHLGARGRGRLGRGQLGARRATYTHRLAHP
eukprot:scaffold38041_cov54-Phaeocystis_antarctica.AAC.2